KDEKEFQGQLNEEDKKKLFELTEAQKIELKKKFRKASTLCHPDKFSNESPEIQKKAEELFKEINEANIRNDLEMISEILEQLEKGRLEAKMNNNISDKEILKTTISRLRTKLRQLEFEILTIKESETYQTIITIEDWNEYFIEIKEKLQSELEELKLR
ncbi:J domain-containing protein, partial [Algoriphagus sp. A40]|uniref:J domain-containing protein n=1 Tax=Algoriphagus sp. A40 TaxID=1945863 RepID=UPI0009CF349F